jgi:60 kDa SS-A/Ro ribonucleoprotein
MSRRNTPQTVKADEKQVANSAGGFSFQADKWDRLDRFLVLGAEGGTYYIKEQKLTRDNVKVIDECAAEDHEKLVSVIVAMSVSGLAPKLAPITFSLAYLSGHKDKEVRKCALAAIPRVCRTGTQLFSFLADVEEFRGWGRTLRDAVAAWYLEKDARSLAYQVTKYQQRGGEDHAGALRRAHVKTDDPDLREVISFSIKKLVNLDDKPEDFTLGDRTPLYEVVHAGPGFANWLTDEKPHRQLLAAVTHAKGATSPDQIVKLIEEHDLVRECIPTQFLNSPKVWEALMRKMPMGAMVRNLGKMTNIGLIGPMSDAAKTVCERLRNQELIQKARVHPVSVLLALTTYDKGHGLKGKLTWNPVPQVKEALDDAFYLAFKNVEPTGKRWLLGLDISGSMDAQCAGTALTCAQAAGAMAMVTMRSEQQWYCHGFADTFVDLCKGGRVTNQYAWGRRNRSREVAGLSSKTPLAEVVDTMFAYTMGRTDCALPMKYAMEKKIPVDVFAVYTDNETGSAYHATPHPHQALQQYRDAMGIRAKLVVVAFASNGFSIAVPDDMDMLDVVGLNASVPAVIADFARN